MAYWLAVSVGVAWGVLVCALACLFPGRTAVWTGRSISLVMATVAVTYSAQPAFTGGWTAAGSLPLNLCDLTLLIAAVTCWFPRWRLGAELTYFWGLAGSLPALLTPDLSAHFPQLRFFEFVVGHLGNVVAAAYLVLGLRLRPRPGAVPRVFVLTMVYAAAVGIVDAITGGDYMYLAHRPAHASLLSVLGPWPWYLASTGAVGIVLFLLLDAPFRHRPLSRQAARPGCG